MRDHCRAEAGDQIASITEELPLSLFCHTRLALILYIMIIRICVSKPSSLLFPEKSIHALENCTCTLIIHQKESWRCSEHPWWWQQECYPLHEQALDATFPCYRSSNSLSLSRYSLFLSLFLSQDLHFTSGRYEPHALAHWQSFMLRVSVQYSCDQGSCK